MKGFDMNLQVEELTRKQSEHGSTVSPGLPASLDGTNTDGDKVWQGDLCIRVSGGVPDGYESVDNPTDEDRQLVPLDGSPGSHHRVKTWVGAKLYRPADWGKSDTDYRGPCVIFDKPNAIIHEPGHSKPHGTVKIESPMTIVCHYQRNLNHEAKAAARARD